MAHQRLIIEADDPERLFLHVEKGTVAIGGNGKHPEMVVQRLRVVRIYCELETDGDPVVSRGQNAATQRLEPGASVLTASARLRVEGGSPEAAPAAAEKPTRKEEEPAQVQMALCKRLAIIDGADQGKVFRLVESGIMTIGRSRKHAQIVLNDLYVGPVHCQIKVEGDTVTVVNQGGPGGTLLGGKKITRQEMHVGEVLRVGNSHLRLEQVMAPVSEKVTAQTGPPGDDDTTFEVSEDAATTTEAGRSGEISVDLLPADAPAAARQLVKLREELVRLSGQILGHYRIGTLRGRGRYGVIFQAEDLRNGQSVALKVFSPLFPQTDAELQHFIRALRELLPLRHSHLATLYAAGRTGIYTWLARELVEGESVAELIRRLGPDKRLDWPHVCRIAAHVAWALECARQHRFHHGRVTPANIILRPKDRAAVLTDLMLENALQGSHLAEAALGYQPPGDLVCLSPEQIEGASNVDELSDLYGLGAVLYTLLTGRLPFAGQTGQEIIQQILGPARIARPSTIHSDIAPQLDQVILKLLAKRQEDRYQSPGELVADLEGLAKREDVDL